MKKSYIVLAAGALAILCTGCGQQSSPVITIENAPYEKYSYKTMEVQQGDLDPSIVLSVKAEGYKIINYTEKTANLNVEKVWVSVGDKVKEGDLLVSFQSEELQNSIDSYEEQIANNNMLIEHYSNLMKINPDADYSTDIKMLKQDNEIAGLYIEEINEQLKNYQIHATSPGTITNVNESLKQNYYIPNNNLVSQACGTGKYTTSTTADYAFAVGDEYTAVGGLFSYRIRISDITESTDSFGNVVKKITYEPLSDMSGVSDADTLTVTIEKPTLEDVLYIDATCVYRLEEGTFVYVVDEEGYRSAVEVKCGDVVGESIVITEGLSVGEKVSLN